MPHSLREARRWLFDSVFSPTIVFSFCLSPLFPLTALVPCVAQKVFFVVVAPSHIFLCIRWAVQSPFPPPPPPTSYQSLFRWYKTVFLIARPGQLETGHVSENLAPLHLSPPGLGYIWEGVGSLFLKPFYLLWIKCLYIFFCTVWVWPAT